jgi:hypothetical protein
MRPFKSIAQLGAVSALAATLAVACGPKSSNSAKVSNEAKQQGIETTLKSAFGGSYNPSKTENLELAGRIEGVSVDLEPFVKGTSEQQESFQGQVRFLLKNEETPITGANGQISRQGLAELTIFEGSAEKYSIQAKCLTAGCVTMVALLTEKGEPSRQVAIMAHRQKSGKNGERAKVANDSASDTALEVTWIASSEPKRFFGLKKPSVDAALKVRVSKGVKPSAPKAEPAAAGNGGESAAAPAPAEGPAPAQPAAGSAEGGGEAAAPPPASEVNP